MESYQIPRFYSLLEDHGVKPLATHSDYEVYRGELNGSVISIKISGQVSHQDDRHLQDLIDLVMEDLNQSHTPVETNNDQYSYMILAKHSRPASYDYPINHLNIWLNSEQYKHALDLMHSSADIEEVLPEYEFETHRFRIDNQVLRYHQNGKIIAEEGYSLFAPYLAQAIEEHLPYSEYDLVIGQDEVGNGERIGPLVVGSVGVTPKQLVDLQLVGVKDSKMVPRRLTAMMTQWIRDIAPISIINQLNPLEFNQKIIEDRSSMSHVLTEAHNLSVKKVIDRLKQLGTTFDKMVYIVDSYDKYERLSIFEDYSDYDFEVKYKTHAEQESISVAAASIIAKSARVRWMELHEKMYQIQLKRKHINKIQQHEKAHTLLKSI